MDHINVLASMKAPCSNVLHFSELQAYNNGSHHKFPDTSKLDCRVDTSNVGNIESQ